MSADRGSLPRVIRLGTRRSLLARTQSQWVADRLAALGHRVELVDIVTHGDVSRAPLASMGGTGVFAAAIRQALKEGRVDLAVHSLKDLPVVPEEGLVVAAIPQREDPRDALIARDGLTLGGLPDGAAVGTGSPRRAAQLAALGGGLRIKAIRGNVDTRINLVRTGELDAVVLAAAGLRRLGRQDEITELLAPVQMLPAPGQGALALETRVDDRETTTAVAALDDPDARAAVTAERAVLAAMKAGCSAPIGVLAEIVEDEDDQLAISLRAFAGTQDGSVELRRSITGPVADAQDLGHRLARVLLADGADRIGGLGGSGSPAAEDDRQPGPASAGDPHTAQRTPTSAAEREK